MNKLAVRWNIKKMGIPHYIILCAAFALQNTPASALDPGRHISQYAHTAWRMQDGYFAGTPQGITQSKDGYVWIATEAGPVRFDGVRFLPWTPPDGSHLPLPGVYSILGASDGSVWFGGGGRVALSRWTKGALVSYPSISGRINSILEDKEGAIWVARSRVHDGTGPLCQITGSNIVHCYAKADGLPFQNAGVLSEDRSGKLWIGSASMLVRWKDGSSELYAPEGLKSEAGLVGIEGLAVDQDGSLWLGMEKAGPGLGLQRIVDGKWVPFHTPMLDGDALEVGALFVDRENVLWVGTTNHGIYRISKNSVDHFDSADGLSSNDIDGFYEDTEGSLWVSTSRGIDCFRTLPVATFSTREGLVADRVGSVLASKDGSVWIGNGGALESLRQGKLSSIKQADGLPGRRVTSILEDHAGVLWIGLDNSLFVLEKGRFTLINRPDGSSMGVITTMTEDIEDNIWLKTNGNPKALVRIRNRKVQEEFDKTQIPVGGALAPDPKGGIWLSLNNGDLARYDQGHLNVVPVTKMASVGPTYHLSADLNGSVWGATGFGLFRWWNDKLKVLTPKNGLPCEDIYSFVRDKQDSLWLEMQCGLVVISDTELRRWWNNPDTVVKLKTFDIFDGAQPSESNFGPDAVRSTDGKLWFAGQAILQTVDPSRQEENGVSPPVHIEQIVADRKTYTAQGELHLPPLVRNLEIDYTALSFVVPQKVRFRYRLDGRDTAWQDSGTRRQAFYTDLRPGKYQFRVIACNNSGVWNETGATFGFSIAPAFYQTTWFRLLLGIAAITLVWLLHSLRLRQATAHTHARLGERLNERGRIARELHDTLIQSIDGLMLRIQTALSESDPKRSRLMIEKALDSADEVMLEGRQRVNALRVEATTVNELSESLAAYGQGLSQDYPVAFSVTLVGSPRAIDAFVRDEAYCIGREALGNAFQHAGATKIEVEVAYSRRLVHMRVRDDGHGIDEQTLNAGRPGHWGLRGMRERAQVVGSKLVIWSRLDVGTEIDLEIPADMAYVGSRALWPSWIKKLIGDRRVMQ